MANHRVHGQHHRHHAHQKHHGHRNGGAHNKQGTHTGAQKPTQAADQAQKPQAQKPVQGTQVLQPAQAPAARDDFKTANPAPVTLTPGASGERKAPVGAAPVASAGTSAGAVKSGGGATPAVPAIPAAQVGTATPATPATPAAPVDPAKQAPTGPADLKWISQLAPAGADGTYTNGEANCGPTVCAMVGKAIGYAPEKTDAALIQELAAVGGTTAEGTSGNGIIAMYDHMGMETTAVAGADLTWINAQLDAGHYLTALGDYYEVPGRVDPVETAGHYMNVSGYTEATKKQEAQYKVLDPMDPNLSYLTATQLQAFIAAAPMGGFVIATWSEAAAATVPAPTTATAIATAAATTLVG